MTNEKKAATENIYARVAPETKAALEALAAKNGRGVSAEIRAILEAAVKEAS